MMSSALFNTTCIIEKQNTAFSEENGEQAVSWEEVCADVKCRLRNRSYSERISGVSEYQYSSHVLYMPYRELGREKVRIKINEQLYKVIGISDMGTAKKIICMYLERYE
ncbi:phage head-tail adaptor [Parelusimicrobium proximum]|uniref:phage head completion protein n=1 Tax=Parelusimicrobium proximum TaxID=3228953 RepID=UPI003D1867C7